MDYAGTSLFDPSEAHWHVFKTWTRTQYYIDKLDSSTIDKIKLRCKESTVFTI